MIDAGNFAKPLNGTNLKFGTHAKEELANELRRIATLVESDQLIIMKVQSGQIASQDDYYTQALMIEFAEDIRKPDGMRKIPQRIITIPTE